MMYTVFLLLGTLATAIAVPNPSARIVGGATAAEGQFPYQASVRYNKRHFCGGSILNEDTILTAAHCVYGFGTEPAGLSVFVGTINNDLFDGQNHFVYRPIIHPEFDMGTAANDVALLKLETKIEFNDDVQAVELAAAEPRDGALVTLSGWGFTSYPSADFARILQYVRVKTVNREACAAELESPELIGEGQICTEEEEQGACQGDDGSPLVDTAGAQVALVSWGVPCARGFPDVHVNVAHYKAWIQENL